MNINGHCYAYVSTAKSYLKQWINNYNLNLFAGTGQGRITEEKHYIIVPKSTYLKLLIHLNQYGLSGFQFNFKNDFADLLLTKVRIHLSRGEGHQIFTFTVNTILLTLTSNLNTINMLIQFEIT